MFLIFFLVCFFPSFFIDVSQALLFMVLMYATSNFTRTMPVKQTLGKDCVPHADLMRWEIENASTNVRLQCRLTWSHTNLLIPSEIWQLLVLCFLTRLQLRLLLWFLISLFLRLYQEDLLKGINMDLSAELKFTTQTPKVCMPTVRVFFSCGSLIWAMSFLHVPTYSYMCGSVLWTTLLVPQEFRSTCSGDTQVEYNEVG